MWRLHTRSIASLVPLPFTCCRFVADAGLFAAVRLRAAGAVRLPGGADDLHRSGEPPPRRIPVHGHPALRRAARRAIPQLQPLAVHRCWGDCPAAQRQLPLGAQPSADPVCQGKSRTAASLAMDDAAAVSAAAEGPAAVRSQLPLNPEEAGAQQQHGVGVPVCRLQHHGADAGPVCAIGGRPPAADSSDGAGQPVHMQQRRREPAGGAARGAHPHKSPVPVPGWQWAGLSGF